MPDLIPQSPKATDSGTTSGAATPLEIVPLLGAARRNARHALPGSGQVPFTVHRHYAWRAGWAPDSAQAHAQPGEHQTASQSDSGAGQDVDPRAIDWALVRALRSQAANELSALLANGNDLDERTVGAGIVTDLVAAHTAAEMSGGAVAPDPAQVAALAGAVMAALFDLGRFQPLVDDPDIENIEVTGCDDVKVTRSDGTIEVVAPVADTDAELIEALQFLASRAASAARPFSPAHPFLHLQLPGGARLAASAWVLPRPSVVIRLHRLRQVQLADLVARDLLDQTMAEFLAAAVRAGKSIVVSGPQGSGKTTLLRALAACMDPWERIATLETERELFLHEMPEAHRRVLAWESRPGGGDRGADGRMHGEIGLGDIVEASLRFNISRLIVGEVRGSEVLAMFQAMQTGAGSMSTTHAHSARAAIERLVTCALSAGPHVTTEFAHRQVAEHINLIVQLGLEVRSGGAHPSRRRFISEIIAVEAGEAGRAATTTLWSRHSAGQRPQQGLLPVELLAALEPHGFDPQTLAGAA